MHLFVCLLVGVFICLSLVVGDLFFFCFLCLSFSNKLDIAQIGLEVDIESYAKIAFDSNTTNDHQVKKKLQNV